jgi:transposase
MGRTYTEEQLHDAIDAVLNGMSQRKAARLHSVSYSTMRSRILRR